MVVADREADLFDLFAAPRPAGVDLLVRAKPRRRLHGDARLLGEAAAAAPVLAALTVTLPRADDRPSRMATLALRAAVVTLERPSVHPRRRFLKPVRLGVVLAEQTDASPGEAPLRWLLLTTRPVGTAEAAVQAVRWYSRRWLIERLHFVLKSGCRIEELQLETAARLQRALATYLIVAWRLLWLTYEARRGPEEPAATVLDATERQVLLRHFGLPPTGRRRACGRRFAWWRVWAASSIDAATASRASSACGEAGRSCRPWSGAIAWVFKVRRLDTCG